MIHSCFIYLLFSDRCSWVPCLSWTVKLPAALQKNPSGPTNTLVLQHFCVIEPFPTMTVWFWDASFHTEDNLCNYYRRFKCSLMLQKEIDALKAVGWKLLNRMEMCTVCTRCEKMYLKIIQSLLERVQIHKNAAKPKYLWDLKDFSEEQWRLNQGSEPVQGTKMKTRNEQNFDRNITRTEQNRKFKLPLTS